MYSNLDRLIEAFDNMKSSGFDIYAPLNWGFYFVDKDKKKLEKLFNELKEKNYILIDIYKTDTDEWTLHASKIDTLTPEKLHKRNNAFNDLADYCNVYLYDGWDVEKIKG
jgi:hypothetical protein